MPGRPRPLVIDGDIVSRGQKRDLLKVLVASQGAIEERADSVRTVEPKR
jgi:hypothetical protein